MVDGLDELWAISCDRWAMGHGVPDVNKNIDANTANFPNVPVTKQTVGFGKIVYSIAFFLLICRNFQIYLNRLKALYR